MTYFLWNGGRVSKKLNPDLWFGSQTAETINKVCHWQTDYEKGDYVDGSVVND